MDQGQRVSSGHVEASLPASLAQLEVLTNLVKRWTPPSWHAQRLDTVLGEIHGRTREFLDRVLTRVCRPRPESADGGGRLPKIPSRRCKC